ncbi:hypothetical protein AKJ08_1158 [Vulgatibacter incomptus]|uniref:Uncharacterized protein n=2 Tax=Vulgatibacter incomptus TaxID=1391653 RepID=A0A0K1PBJ1_9BACT|nr:hypothetical protein AKJ08_1158 [Vulgatibacter incomptus]
MRRYRGAKGEPFFWSREKVAASLGIGKNAVAGVYEAAKANGWIVCKTINVTYQGVERTRVGWMVTSKGEQEALGTTNAKPAATVQAKPESAPEKQAGAREGMSAPVEAKKPAHPWDNPDIYNALLAASEDVESSFASPAPPAPTLLDAAKEVARELAEVAAEAKPEQGSKITIALIEWDAKWNTRERFEAADALNAEEEAALVDDEDVYVGDYDSNGHWNQ